MDVRALADEVTDRTIDIAQIPAPHGAEQNRADVVGRWWRDAGFALVTTDEMGNCWAQVRGGTGPAVVLAAHLDTVFGPEIDHVVNRRGDRLVGPSVGDDSVALAALGAVGQLIAASDGSVPVLLVATVGEEGYGLLAGARHAVGHPPMKLGAFIAIEGNYLGRPPSACPFPYLDGPRNDLPQRRHAGGGRGH
jgi:tripeptide aminopeptidase